MKFRYIVFSILMCVCAFSKPTLTWQDNSSDELGFRIERAIVGQPFVEVGRVGVNVITFVDNVTEVGTYQYRVCAYNAYGDSKFSNVETYVFDPNAPNNAVIKITMP